MTLANVLTFIDVHNTSAIMIIFREFFIFYQEKMKIYTKKFMIIITQNIKLNF